MTNKVDEWISDNDNGRIPGTAIFETQMKRRDKGEKEDKWEGAAWESREDGVTSIKGREKSSKW